MRNKLKDEIIKLNQQLYVKELQVNMLNEIIKNQGEAKRQYDKDLFTESYKYQKRIIAALHILKSDTGLIPDYLIIEKVIDILEGEDNE